MRLIVNDEALLRRPCLPAGRREGSALARRLFAWLAANNRAALKGKATPAAGVAAPQLGILKAVCVTLANGRPTAFVNPRVAAHSPVAVVSEEGCLSFPGRLADVWRWLWVEVEADNFGAPMTFGPRGVQAWDGHLMFESAAVQHELDHLAGRLFFDGGVP